MGYFHLTSYYKFNILPPTLQQIVSYSSHAPMILLFMTCQGRGRQSKRSTILETKAGIIRRGLMVCGHRLQSGSKNPQDIPPLVRCWGRGHTFASSSNQQLQPRTHKHIQGLRHMQLASRIKTKMHKQT